MLKYSVSAAPKSKFTSNNFVPIDLYNQPQCSLCREFRPAYLGVMSVFDGNPAAIDFVLSRRNLLWRRDSSRETQGGEGLSRRHHRRGFLQIILQPSPHHQRTAWWCDPGNRYPSKITTGYSGSYAWLRLTWSEADESWDQSSFTRMNRR